MSTSNGPQPRWSLADLDWKWWSEKALLLALTVGVVVLFTHKPSPTPAPPSPVEPQPAIAIPVEVRSPVGKMVDVEATTRGKEVRWSVPDGVDVRQLSSTSVVLVSAVPGRYRILAWTCLDGSPTEAAVCTLVVGDSPPGPGPTPPGPGPAPDGFRVLMVYESRANNTKEQLAVLYSPKIQDYLTRKCKGGKDGWRRWDKDVEEKYVPEELKKVMEAAKPSLGALPAIVVASGSKIDVLAMPPNVSSDDEILSVLKKYGGD